MRHRSAALCLPALFCLAAPALGAPLGSAKPGATQQAGTQGATSDMTVLDTPRSAAALVATRVGQSVRVALPGARGQEILDLERINPIAPGAHIVAVDETGAESPIDLSNLVLLRGSIAGDPDSLVFVSVADDRVNGFVRAQDGLRVISSGEGGFDGPIAVEYTTDLNLGDGTPFCSVDTQDPSYYPDHSIDSIEPTDHSDATQRGGAPCRVARIAVDSDYEFTQIFGGDTTASASYALTLMAASSSVYERDLNVRFIVPYLRVFSANVDPYFGSSGTGNFLDEMRDHWNVSKRHVPRETVHGLSGRSLGGGVAYVNALCSGEYAHGVSANMNGSFPMPVQDNSHSNWDLMVVSHELGHNFGTGHTHDQNSYNPVIDGCGNGDCALALDSTIMSYCHLCSGGMSNMDMRFHPRVQTRIHNFLNSVACDLTTGSEVAAINDVFTVHEGETAPLDVLSNDAAASCSHQPVAIVAHDTTTIQGGTVALETGAAGQKLVYTPAPGFSGVDSFSYTTGAGSAAVTVLVEPLRQAWLGETVSGLDASYYALSSPSSMPDYDSMTPFAVEVVQDINFVSTSGDFAGSGLADNVGAVFEGFVDVPEDGWYQLSIESDDGSMLYIDNELLVNNDGLHGMEDRWGYIPLAAGRHALRAEFFEAGGGAGVIVRFLNRDIPRQVIPWALLSRRSPDSCPADLVAPFGTLNFFDVTAFMGLWQDGAPQADLAAPFGTHNFFDLSAYIDQFAAGCP